MKNETTPRPFSVMCLFSLFTLKSAFMLTELVPDSFEDLYRSRFILACTFASAIMEIVISARSFDWSCKTACGQCWM